VLEPWESGPSDARAELFAVLSALEPDLPDWLKASWDDIMRDGPKAASKVANCTVECIDRALRAAAPNSEIISWLEGRVFLGEILHDGRPTRRARVMFAMRGRSKRDTALAAAQVESLVILLCLKETRSPRAGGHAGSDGAAGLSVGKPGTLGGAHQRGDHSQWRQQSCGYELAETERGSVEGVVARAWPGGGD
jgi:hypothetical protein